MFFALIGDKKIIFIKIKSNLLVQFAGKNVVAWTDT
jgi:hypothetical protein